MNEPGILAMNRGRDIEDLRHLFPKSWDWNEVGAGLELTPTTKYYYQHLYIYKMWHVNIYLG